MTRDEIITLLLRRAGQREGDATLENQLLAELPFIQEEMENNGVQLPNGAIFWPQFLLSEVSTTTTTQGEHRVSLPDDFLTEPENGALIIEVDGDLHRLEKGAWDNLYTGHQDEGVPEHYSIFGDYFYLFPPPDDVYTLRMVYYQANEKLDNANENRWTKHAPRLLLASLGFVMADQYIHDRELAQSFLRDRTRAAQQLYYAEVGREQANMSTVMGGYWYG